MFSINAFLLKKLKASKDTFKKPWMTRGLLKSIKRKNKLYQKFLRNPSSVNENLYKIYKNKLNHSLRIAKRLYYESSNIGTVRPPFFGGGGGRGVEIH